MLLKKIKLSFSLLNALPHVLLGMKCFDKICFVIFTVQRVLIFSYGMLHLKFGILTKISIKG